MRAARSIGDRKGWCAMAFVRNKAKCPFCSSDKFAVSLSVNDMLMPNELSKVEERLTLTCIKFSRIVFEVTITKGKQVSAVGVSVCEKCSEDLFNASGRRRPKDISSTTYPVGTVRCSKCNSQLKKCWWHGWDYII
jgi:hypothetical protein